MVTSIFLQQLFVFQSDCSHKLPSMPTCAESTEGASTEGTQVEAGVVDRPRQEQQHFRRKTFLFSLLRSLEWKHAAQSEPISLRRKFSISEGSYAAGGSNFQGAACLQRHLRERTIPRNSESWAAPTCGSEQHARRGWAFKGGYFAGEGKEERSQVSQFEDNIHPKAGEGVDSQIKDD